MQWIRKEKLRHEERGKGELSCPFCPDPEETTAAASGPTAAGGGTADAAETAADIDVDEDAPDAPKLQR